MILPFFLLVEFSLWYTHKCISHCTSHMFHHSVSFAPLGMPIETIYLNQHLFARYKKINDANFCQRKLRFIFNAQHLQKATHFQFNVRWPTLLPNSKHGTTGRTAEFSPSLANERGACFHGRSTVATLSHKTTRSLSSRKTPTCTRTIFHCVHRSRRKHLSANRTFLLRPNIWSPLVIIPATYPTTITTLRAIKTSANGTKALPFHLKCLPANDTDSINPNHGRTQNII